MMNRQAIIEMLEKQYRIELQEYEFFSNEWKISSVGIMYLGRMEVIKDMLQKIYQADAIEKLIERVS